MINSRLLRGDKVRLTALAKEDAPVIACWDNDIEYLQLADTNPARPRNEAQWAATIERHAAMDDLVEFAIRTVTDNLLIGTCELSMIEWTNGAAHVGIGVGEREYWGRGYGAEAMNLLLAYAFEELNLHALFLDVIAYNERAIRCYERVGFQRTGVYREFGLRAGQRYDMYLYSLLRPEWLVRRERAAALRRTT